MQFNERRQDRVYWLLVALIFGIGVFVRCSIPGPPFSDPDIRGYLNPALSWLTQGEFAHTNGREFPYPLFLCGVLRIFGNFNCICYVQHALGLAAGAILLRTWHRMLLFFPASRATGIAGKILGLAILSCFLLSAGQVGFEHSIRPEAITSLFAALLLWLVTEYVIAFRRTRASPAAFLLGAGSIYAAAFLFYLKPAFGLAAGGAVLPVLASLFFFRGRHAYRACLILLPLALVMATLWYPERRLVAQYDRNSEKFLSTLLLCFQARILRQEMVADLKSGAPLPFDRAMLGRVVELIDEELSAPTHVYDTLGFNPDHLIYGRDSAGAELNRYFKGDMAGYNAFCMRYYKAAWRRQPGAMSAKVIGQMWRFYSMRTSPFSYNAWMKAGNGAGKNTEWLAPIASFYKPAADYLAANERLKSSPWKWREGVLLSAENALLQLLYPVTVLFSLGFAALLVFWRNRPLASELLFPALWTLYLFSYNWWNCLTIAIIHTTELSRYLKPQITYTLLAEAAGILLFVVLAQKAKFSCGGRSGRPAAL